MHPNHVIPTFWQPHGQRETTRMLIICVSPFSWVQYCYSSSLPRRLFLASVCHRHDLDVVCKSKNLLSEMPFTDLFTRPNCPYFLRFGTKNKVLWLQVEFLWIHYLTFIDSVFYKQWFLTLSVSLGNMPIVYPDAHYLQASGISTNLMSLGRGLVEMSGLICVM